jgi:superfamily II DNA or RNA helicase
MQVEALQGIEAIRSKGEDKALLISATGTGKTYLACFDVAKVQPKRLLFIAHREQLLNQAIKSFKNVLGSDISVGKVGGGRRELANQFTFSTVQTMSKQDVLNNISEDHFDYIVIDESHKAGASSYQKILNHFKPNFLLGMTATPERTDDYNICEDFNYNIAYEIRLEQAMRENMLCPFHYFGVTEFLVDGKEITENSAFNYLISDNRVNHIIEKMKFYGHDGERTKGLIFCSRNEEASELSKAFNNRGFRTIAMGGKNSQDEREEAIERLEKDKGFDCLDYIFTVDIFNEGVDIPQINQVIMLRPTKSAIVFVQQLGRGLRKVLNKEYVVVLDFIGNYQNNFMIPIALSDDRSFNKDTIRRFVAEGNRIIPGCTTINFDAISRKKIYDSIDSANFTSVALIKEQYKNLKYRIGHIPSPLDFEHHDSFDIAKIFDNNNLKSYHTFLKKYESDYSTDLNEIQEKFIECISVKFAKGKRPHELLILKAMLDDIAKPFDYMASKLENDYDIYHYEKTFTNVKNILTNEFSTGSSKKTYQTCQFIDQINDEYVTSNIFNECLQDEPFRKIVNELVELGLYRNKKYYGKTYKNSSLQLYQKYTYEDVCRLLEWEKNVVSLNIGGYKYDDHSKTFPVFINYHKADDISDTIKYEDRFISNERLIAISKAKRTVESNDVVTIYNAKQLGVTIELFVRKHKKDEGSKEFYYLGRMNTIGQPKPIKMNVDGPNAVELTYQLETSVREDIYDYISEV